MVYEMMMMKKETSDVSWRKEKAATETRKETKKNRNKRKNELFENLSYVYYAELHPVFWNHFFFIVSISDIFLL